MIFSCLLTGVGDQGLMLVSRLIGAAAIAKGLDVRGSDSGSVLQGGSVVSHVRMGQNIYSPLIPRGKADLVIAFEPAEAVRVHSFLSPTGRMLVLDRGIAAGSVIPGEGKYESAEMLNFLDAYFSHPSQERASQTGGGDWLTVIDTGALTTQCGSSGVLNTALLGVAAEKKFFPFTAEDLLNVIKDQLPPDSLDVNIRAFNAGRDIA